MMKNVWKGLVVGGLTGVTAGVVLDSIARASRKAAEIGGQVREHAPDAGRWVQSLSDKAGDWIHDADVPEHVRGAAQRVKESDAAHRAKELGADAVAAAKDATTSHAR
jgi:hypothetical protein